MEQFTHKEVEILESFKFIQESRERLVIMISKLDTSSAWEEEKLEDSKWFQYFKRDADESMRN